MAFVHYALGIFDDRKMLWTGMIVAAAYVGVAKEFVDRKPVTWYSITAKGRKALRAHLSALERMIGQAGGAGGRKR